MSRAKIDCGSLRRFGKPSPSPTLLSESFGTLVVGLLVADTKTEPKSTAHRLQPNNTIYPIRETILATLTSALIISSSTSLFIIVPRFTVASPLRLDVEQRLDVLYERDRLNRKSSSYRQKRTQQAERPTCVRCVNPAPLRLAMAQPPGSQALDPNSHVIAGLKRPCSRKGTNKRGSSGTPRLLLSR